MSFKQAHQNIQRTVLNHAKTDSVSNFLLAIISASLRNGRITPVDFGREAGKKRKLTLNFLPPLCEEDNTECTTTICSPGQVREPEQADFTISKCTASKVMMVRMENMRDLDNIVTNQWVAEIFANELRIFRQRLAKQVGALMVANVGKHLDGSSHKMANLVNTQTGVVNPIAQSTIEKTFIDAELNAPMVVGGDSVFYAQAMKQIGGLNAQGQNVGARPLQNYFYDSLVNTLFSGGENLLAFDPNVFKFIAWNRNMGRFASDDTNINPEQMYSAKDKYFFGTIADPITGLLLDLDGEFFTCNERGEKDPHWRFQFRLEWDIFFLPKQVCWGESGVNGIFHFKGCEPQEQQCP